MPFSHSLLVSVIQGTPTNNLENRKKKKRKSLNLLLLPWSFAYYFPHLSHLLLVCVLFQNDKELRKWYRNTIKHYQTPEQEAQLNVLYLHSLGNSTEHRGFMNFKTHTHTHTRQILKLNSHYQSFSKFLFFFGYFLINNLTNTPFLTLAVLFCLPPPQPPLPFWIQLLIACPASLGKGW